MPPTIVSDIALIFETQSLQTTVLDKLSNDSFDSLERKRPSATIVAVVATIATVAPEAFVITAKKSVAIGL